MSNLAVANSYTWSNDFDRQSLDIEVSHFNQESFGYVAPDEMCRMVMLTVKDRERDVEVTYEMGPRDVETMVKALTKLIDR